MSRALRGAPHTIRGRIEKTPPIPDRLLWVNGKLCRGADAMLSLFDRGARDGEGLFETLRVESGRPLEWTRHLERLVLSAAELGFPVPPSPDHLREGLSELLAASGLSDAVARLTVTRGIPGGRPTRTGAWIEAEPLESRLWRGTRAGAASIVISKTRFEPGPLGRHKTTSRLAYHLAREEARVSRADEALLVAADGELLEGAVSNLFLVIGAEVRTPRSRAASCPGSCARPSCANARGSACRHTKRGSISAISRAPRKVSSRIPCSRWCRSRVREPARSHRTPSPCASGTRIARPRSPRLPSPPRARNPPALDDKPQSSVAVTPHPGERATFAPCRKVIVKACKAREKWPSG